MKILLVLSILFMSMGVQAILVCPEIHGYYKCEGSKSVNFGIWQYENHDNVMVYEMFENSFIADGKIHIVYETNEIKVEHKTECDYSKLRVSYVDYDKLSNRVRRENVEITRINSSKFLYENKVVTTTGKVARPEVFKSMICELQ